ncbi:Protein yippee-like [Vigna angularis]|uniref:Protein yippee-like n=1 Tax=Phaseolus angularis TaxID=3914 RepID=A0A8T0KD17_PHAAN|nr:Protein yippee-like [Vigna angularis]
MGRIFTVELEGRSYGCKSCKTHLALADDLISRLAKFTLICRIQNIISGSIILSSLKLSCTNSLWKYDILFDVSIAVSTTIENKNSG